MDHRTICDRDIFTSNPFVRIFSPCFDCDTVISHVNMAITNTHILQDSGSIPSVFGESAGFKIVKLSNVALLQRIGLIVQLGDWISLISFTVIRWQLWKLINLGRG